MNKIIDKIANEPVFSVNEIHDLLMNDSGVTSEACSRITDELSKRLWKRKSYEINLSIINAISEIICKNSIGKHNDPIKFHDMSPIGIQTMVDEMREVLLEE
ncbi:hypothetical protein [Barnesiella intestinihominis]|uniref:hypothetical protein n=1 Tax=Barnesiella intestinihominis TaxID=487174 RepID=UPI0024325FDB|nr:hypothetical protein [Barnesiella intestinihominis]